MFKSILRPARTQSVAASNNVVRDLDALLGEPIAFRLHGKVHEMKPLSTQDFLKYTGSMMELLNLKDKSNVTADELIDHYHEMIQAVCKTVERKDIEDMNQQQIGALFQLILDTVSGKSQVDAELEKKKTLKQ